MEWILLHIYVYLIHRWVTWRRGGQRDDGRRAGVGVIHAWMEEGGHPALDEREAQGLLYEVLVLFNITQPLSFLDYALPILQLSLTCQIIFLFLLSGFGFAKKGEWAEGGGTAVRDRGAGKDSISCGRIIGEGHVWVHVGEPHHAPPCPPSHLSPKNATNLQPPPSLCHPHKSTRKLHLKLLLLPWKNWSWHWKSPL